MRISPAQRTALVGIMATATMDVATIAAWKLLGVGGISRKVRPDLLGRWIGYMRRGQFRHPNIRRAPSLANEMPAGIASHYLIGAALTGAYFGLLRAAKIESTLPVAIAYGAATSVLPWLTMYPAYGYGWFGLREAPDGALIGASIGWHAVFGLGIGVWTKVLVRPA